MSAHSASQVKGQFTLDTTPRLSPSQQKILEALRNARGEWVSGRILNNYAFAYSQRIGELIEKGYRIERDKRDGIGIYRLGERDDRA